MSEKQLALSVPVAGHALAAHRPKGTVNVASSGILGRYSLNSLSARRLYIVLLILLVAHSINICADTPTPLPHNVTLNGTPCDYVDALVAANTDTATGDCPAGDGADTITLLQDISLVSPEVHVVNWKTVTSTITLEGAGHSISANYFGFILRVQSGGRLTVNNVTLQDGWAGQGGGAIRNNEGYLAINNSVIRNSGGLGFYAAVLTVGGETAITNSTFQDNGILDIFDAKPGWGGAVGNYIGGRTSIHRSAFINNSSVAGGGAIININPNSVMTITNSTFSGNKSTNDGSLGGAIINYADLTITNSTFHGNSADKGGGIYNYPNVGSLKLRNSIIAGSQGGGDCEGTLVENVNNIIEDGSCAATLSLDPKLGALTGSPAYFPLLDDSPALSAGDSTHCPATDQAGNARPNPSGANCDIGAYESSAVLATYTPTVTDTPMATATETPTATVTDTPTNTPTLAPKPGCVNVGPGVYWRFPSSSFLNGEIATYDTDQCESEAAFMQQIGEDGYVYTADGHSAAVALCQAGHGGSGAYRAQQQGFNRELWACQLLSPTDTPIPPTNTLVPTDTPIPSTNVPVSAPGRAHGLTTALTGSSVALNWSAPADGGAVNSYRIWRRLPDMGENGVRVIVDNTGSAATSYVDGSAVAGQKHIYRVQALNRRGEGQISKPSQIVVKTAPANTPIPPTDTPIPPTNTLVPPTNTPIPPTATPVPPTSTPVPPTNTPVPGPPGRAHSLTASQSGDSVELSWSEPDDGGVVSGYRIWRRLPNKGEQKLLVLVDNTGSTATSYSDSSAEDRQKHIYRVQALGPGGEGEWSRPGEVIVRI